MAKMSDEQKKDFDDGVQYISRLWLKSFTTILSDTQNADLAAVCANNVLRTILYGRGEANKEKQDEERYKKLVNRDGTLNISEWLKGFGEDKQ